MYIENLGNTMRIAEIFSPLPAAKATTSYASGKEELIARKEVDKIKTPY